jgi:hypothetical protein
MCALWLECGELPASSRLGVGHERVPCRVLHATHSMLRGVSRPWRPPSPALDGQRPPNTRTGRPAMLRSAEVGRRRDDRRLRPRSLVSKAALITRGSACQPAGGGGLFCLPAADAALVEEPCNEVQCSGTQCVAHLCLIASLPTFISSALAALQPLLPV